MSMVTDFAPLVKMLLLSRSFTVRISAIGVPQLPGILIRLLPTVCLMRYGSDFSGRLLAQILPYVTSFHLLAGTSFLYMKMNVLLPF